MLNILQAVLTWGEIRSVADKQTLVFNMVRVAVDLTGVYSLSQIRTHVK